VRQTEVALDGGRPADHDAAPQLVDEAEQQQRRGETPGTRSDAFGEGHRLDLESSKRVRQAARRQTI
jgi:hypothetical protein